jgi:hypothetical protein
MPSAIGHGSGEASERIALYLRVSSEEQVERMSIGTQEEFLKQYGDLYRLNVVKTYRDDGISGAVPMHERPAGGQLLKDAAAGEFDVLLVYKLDRVGRTLVGVVEYPRPLEHRGRGPTLCHGADRHLHAIGAPHLPHAGFFRRVRAGHNPGEDHSRSTPRIQERQAERDHPLRLRR